MPNIDFLFSASVILISILTFLNVCVFIFIQVIQMRFQKSLVEETSITWVIGPVAGTCNFWIWCKFLFWYHIYSFICGRCFWCDMFPWFLGQVWYDSFRLYLYDYYGLWHGKLAAIFSGSWSSLPYLPSGSPAHGLPKSLWLYCWGLCESP